MVIVVASTQVKPESRAEFINIFKEFAQAVRKEQGCIEYFPAVDLPTEGVPQTQNPNEITILEKWESMAALQAHLQTPGMKAFGKKSGNMVTGMSLKVLQPA